jgi:hypothetical protein
VARALIAVLTVAAALAGCGGDDSTETAAPPAATDTPTATATPSATPTETAQPLPSVSPEDEPGGQGDEQPIRIPAEFTFAEGGAVKPTQVAVPAFFTIELIVHNQTSQPIDVRFAGEQVMTVEPGGTGDKEVKGRKKGSWVLDAGAAGQALVVTGAKPGP